MGDVKIVVTVDEHGNTKKIKDFDKAIQDLGQGAAGAEKQGGAFGATMKGLVPAFAATAVAAAVLNRAVTFLRESFIESVRAAIEAEKVDRALESSLDIIGRSAGGTAEAIKAYASALQKKTVYDDEAIKSAQTLIIQMRGTTNQLGLATKGAIGLASVFGMDLNNAARTVALGFEGNYRALGQLIPAVRDAKTEGEKYAAMVKGLSDYYQRAEADTKTFDGRLKVLKVTFGEITETLGGFITKNEKVIETLGGIKEIIIWLDRNASKLTKSPLVTAVLEFGPFSGILRDLNFLSREAKKANDEYANSWEGLAARFMEARGRGVELVPIITKLSVFKKLIPEIEAPAKAINLFTENLEELAIAYANLDETINWEELFPPDIEFENPLQSFIDAAIDGAHSTESAWTRAVRNIQEEMEKIAADTGRVFAMLDSIFAQSQMNREIAIDNEYRARLDTINRTITDEDAKQKAIMALEAEYQIKRTEARRAGAKQQKAIAMMEAIVNTASAVTEALPNIFLAALVAALGAVQIATIAAQPIPLAKGGYFKKPTIIPAMDRSYAIAEGGSAEVVSPVPILRQIVREEGGGRGVNVSFGPGAIAIYAQTLDDRTIDQAGAKIYRAVESRLRLRGRRL